MSKLTENEVIEYLSKWLEKGGWKILSISKGHCHGIDLMACKDEKTLIVEAKGSKGNPKSHVTKREKFDAGQIKIHLGEALVKILEERSKNPNATFAIAQPNDDYIRNCLKNIIPEVRKMDIKLFWVESETEITEK